MKMLSRAALLLSAAALCAPAMASQDSNAALALAQIKILQTQIAAMGGGDGLAAALAQQGVRQIGSTVTAAAFTIPNDPSQFYLMNSASAQVVTLPAGLTKWAAGNTLTLVQLGAGQVQLVAGSGVTIVKRSSTLNSAGQYSVVTLVNIGPDTWLVAGGLS